MPKDRIAEQLLALVTSRERAASTVGDLMEDAAARGDLWFWSSVVRTACAHLWRSFAAERGNLLKLGVRGWLFAAALDIAAQMCVIVATFGVLGIVYTSLEPGRPLDWARILQGRVLWTYYSMLFGLPVLCNFQVGRWVARRAPGRELPAALILNVMQVGFWVLFTAALAALEARGIKPPSGNWNLPADVIPFILGSYACILFANLAGAVWVRRRAAA